MKQALLNNATPFLAPAIKASLKKFYRSEKQVTPLENARSVLVFAPHIDDETIGLGGTIRKYASNGAEVHIAVITDGNKSNTSGSANQSLAEIRKSELVSIQDLLGFSSIIYMEYQDSAMAQVESSDPFKKLIDEIRPDVIYTPSLIDAHPDHVFSSHLVAAALKNSIHQPSLIREYEINCPVPPEEINCIIDITDEFEVKKQATRAFKSQVIAFDGFLALASIKASLVSDARVKYVETFVENAPAAFIKAAENLKKQDRNYQNHFKQANRTITLWWAIFKNINFKKALYQSR
ncbi:PIG-L deacetylase family protein [Planococcus sp. 1R117A]|uniref:PIG-L deacetylase family protein n=1 Tax=Planococcus sp. 1R117A TaxID=3447020 RepID=UPI003EDBB30C